MVGTGCTYFCCFVCLPIADSCLAEHHVLYQYNLAGARDHYIGLMQTETVCGFPEQAA